MALAVSRPIAVINSTSNASSYAMAAFTPTANALLVLFIWASDTWVDPGSVSGGGLTWSAAVPSTPFPTYGASGQHSAYMYYAQVGGSPASTTVTWNCAADAATGAVMVLFQVTGHDTSSPIVQALRQDCGTAANPSIAVAAMNTANAYLAGVGTTRSPPTSTPPTNWTEVADNGYSTPTNGATAAYRVNGETGTSVQFTTASSTAGFVGLFAEIRPASTGVSGTLSSTLGALTAAATGTVDVTGTSSKTLGTLTSSAAGAVDVVGTFSKTLDALSISAAGTVADALSSGVLAVTLGALTSNAAGAVDVTGALTKTLGALTSTAAGTVPVTGSSSSTLGTLTSSAAATVAVAGAVSLTLGALAVSAAATVAVAGAVSKALGALTLDASGVVGNVPITGTSSTTLGVLSVSAAAAVAVAGAVSKTLGALTVGATGTNPITGSASPTLGTLTSNAAGAVAVVGMTSATLGTLTAAATGSAPALGTLSTTLGSLELFATGLAPTGAAEGAVNTVLGALTAEAYGKVYSLRGSVGLTRLTSASISIEVSSASITTKVQHAHVHTDKVATASVSSKLSTSSVTVEAVLAQRVGNTARLRLIFKNDEGEEAEPTTFTMVVTTASGESTYTKGDPEFTQVRAGVYDFRTVLSVAGRCDWEVWATGAFSARDKGNFVVKE